MRKSERLFKLFKLVTLLQGRRTAITGQSLADKLGVGIRTVYRDIQALVLSGVPIDGEAGVGYRLRKGFDLPPLMVDMDEVTALLAGSRMVQAWTDPELAEAARRAEAKILAVLTPAMLNENIAPALPHPELLLPRTRDARTAAQGLRVAAQN